MTQRLPTPPKPRRITEDRDLQSLTRRWLRCEAIALDTEFVRTRTYYPKLGLVQIGDPRGVFLIDAVELEDLQPLVEVLASDSVAKVLHSPSEDFEVFQHFFGEFPSPFFDTQIAATLAGYGSSLAYQRLVQEAFGIELPKGEQRSNWMRRPLSASQMEYAALDVAYLLPLHEKLLQELQQLGRRDWAREEFNQLAEAARARLDPERLVERLRRGSMSARERATLRELVLWRERQAQRRDLPRNFVLRDAVLVELAKKRPKTTSGLLAVSGLGARQRRRYGDRLLAAVRRAAAATIEEEGRHRDGRVSARRVSALREVVQKAAAAVDLPPEFLARRKLLEELVANVRNGREELPDGLSGWRREVVGEKLLEACQEG